MRKAARPDDLPDNNHDSTEPDFLVDEAVNIWLSNMPLPRLLSSAESIEDDAEEDDYIEISFIDDDEEESDSEPSSEIDPATARFFRERDEELANTIRAMRESDDPVARLNGQQLDAMFNSPKRNLVRAIALMSTPQIERLLTIFNDPTARRAAGRLEEVLASPGGFINAGSFLDSLNSADVAERTQGESLFAMLNSMRDGKLGQALLDGFDIGADERRRMLEWLNNPANEEAANTIRSLLNTDETTGYRIIALVASDDQTARTAGTRLLARASNPTTRATAIAVSSLFEPKQMLKMMDILDNPSEETLARNLLRMLESEAGAVNVRTVLELTTSQFQVDRRQGTDLLSLLNDPQKSELAERLLDIDDIEERNHILLLVLDPATRSAVPRILDLRESPDRANRRVYNDLLWYLESDNASERQTGQSLVRLFSADDTANLATTILKTFQSPEATSHFLSLIAGGANGRALRDLFMRSRDDRLRVQAAIELRFAGTEGKDTSSGKQKPTSITAAIDHAPTSDRLLRMLTSSDAAERDLAENLIDRVIPPTRIYPLIALMSTQPAAVREVLRMLNSADPRERTGAGVIVAMLATEGPLVPRGDGGRRIKAGGLEPVKGGNGLFGGGKADIRDSGLDVEYVRVDSIEQTNAHRIMSLLESNSARAAGRSFIQVVSSPSDVIALNRVPPGAPRDNLISLLANPATSSAARTSLENLDGDALTAMLGILSDPSKRALSTRLIALLPEAPREVRSLLENIDRPDKQQLCNMLVDANLRLEAAEILINVPEPLQGTLLAMFNNREQRRVAGYILNLFGSENNNSPQAAANFLNMVARGTPSGQRLLQTLVSGSRQEADMARLMVSNLVSEDQVNTLFQLMDKGPSNALSTVLGILGGGEERVALARELLSSRNSGATNSHLFNMLNTPGRSVLAEKIIESLNAVDRDRMVALLNSPSQQNLAANLSTLLLGNANQRGHVSTLLNENDQTGLALRNLLSNQATRSNTLSLMGLLERSEQVVAMMNLVSDGRQTGAVQEIRQLLSSGNSTSVAAAKNLLSMVDRPEGQQLLAMLNDANTRQRAREIISVGDSGSIILMQRMLNTESSRDTAERLLNMFNNPNQRSTASRLLTQLGPRQIGQLFAIRDNEATRSAGEFLMRLSDEQPSTVFQLLELSSARHAQRLLSMLNDESSPNFAIALDVIRLGEANIGIMLDILDNPNNRESSAELVSMMRSDDFATRQKVDSLFNLLRNDITRQEGQRLLAMLGDSRHRGAALRILGR